MGFPFVDFLEERGTSRRERQCTTPCGPPPLAHADAFLSTLVRSSLPGSVWRYVRPKVRFRIPLVSTPPPGEAMDRNLMNVSLRDLSLLAGLTQVSSLRNLARKEGLTPPQVSKILR